MKTYEEVKQAVYDYIIGGANEGLLIDLHNAVCEKDRDFYGHIWPEGDLFDVYLNDLSAEDIFRAAIYADDSKASYGDFRYWTFDGYGNVVFLNYVDEDTINVNPPYLANEVAQYWVDCGEQEISNIDHLADFIYQAIESFNNQ